MADNTFNFDLDAPAVPTLTLDPVEAPAAEEKQPEPAAAPEAEQVKLSPEEQAMVDAFAQKIDITNSQQVLQYGSACQKKIGDFSEAAHRDCCGETGIIEILRAYHDCGFEGYIRPDHGRQLWEEGPGSCRPGYGKYDRALGIQYMLGVWDLLDRLDEEKKKG